MQQKLKKIIAELCIVFLLFTAVHYWYTWYTTYFVRYANQVFGQLQQQHAPTSMCWGISTDGTEVRIVIAVPPPFASNIEPIATYKAHTSPVTALSCDLGTVASVDEEGTVHVWEGHGETTVMTLHCDGQLACPLKAVAWKPGEQRYISAPPRQLLSRRYLAFGGDSGVVQLVSVPDGKIAARYTLPPSAHITCLQWSSDGRYLAVGGYTSSDGKGLVQVWDGQTQQMVSTYQGHAQAVNALAWSPDNRQIATASDDTTVQIWKATTAKHVLTYQGHSQSVRALSWTSTSSNTSLIASGSDDCTVDVWEAGTGQLRFVHYHYQEVTAVIWSSGSWIASSSRTGVIDYYWGVDNLFYFPGW